MHDEERALDTATGGTPVGPSGGESESGGSEEPPVRHGRALRSRTNMPAMAPKGTSLSRKKQQAVRATRLHAEHRDLEARAEAKGLKTRTFCGPVVCPTGAGLHLARASRLHAEERLLSLKDRRRLQRVRAQRLHDEERLLELAATH
mmetsp:Transcript_33252/g.87096  ORF Transcript_33252/g.87096 Transcript_33252/m.87096 type:complete len:147 (+) Transcript_33252:34-474(+)